MVIGGGLPLPPSPSPPPRLLPRLPSLASASATAKLLQPYIVRDMRSNLSLFTPQSDQGSERGGTQLDFVRFGVATSFKDRARYRWRCEQVVGTI